MAKKEKWQETNGKSKVTAAPPLLSVSIKIAIFLGVIALALYANTLRNDYTLDDFIVVKNNAIVAKGVAGIPELLGTPYHLGHSTFSNDLYRPLSLVMFAIESQFFGNNAAIGHFLNILVFAGCVVLLFLFLDDLFEGKQIVLSFLSTLLFALHPIHTEVVANIKSRDELLCFLFSFAALVLFMRYNRAGRLLHLIGGYTCLFVALLSKETAITLVVIVPMAFFIYQNFDIKKSLFISIGVLGIAAVYLSIRFSVLTIYHASQTANIEFIDNMLVSAPSGSVRIATALAIMGRYIWLLIIPHPLICDYSYNSIPFISFGNPACLISLVLYLSISALALYRLRKMRKDPLAFGILFFLITVSLFSNIPFLIGAAMAERFIFFASAGFCLCVAFVIDKWIWKGAGNDLAKLRNTPFLVIFLPICLTYVILTITRNADWKDNNTLYSADILKNPANSRLHYYLGTSQLIDAENNPDNAAGNELTESGIMHLKRSLAIYPGFNLVLSELGNTYLHIRKYDSAQKFLEEAMLRNPADSAAMHNLSAVYFFENKYAQSISMCRAAIAIDPRYARGYRNMASCYLKLGQPDSAVFALKSAIVVDPGPGSSYQNLAYIFKSMGILDSAKKYEAIAKERNPAFSISENTAPR